MALQPGMDNSPAHTFEWTFFWSPEKSLGPYAGIKYVSSENNTEGSEVSPTQYIDTGIIPDYTCSMELCFKPTDDNTQIYVGSRGKEGAGALDKFTVNAGSSPTRIVAGFGKGDNHILSGNKEPKQCIVKDPITEKESVTVKLSGDGVWLNGEQVVEKGSMDSSEWAGKHTVQICCCNQNGNSVYPAKIWVYYVKIWQGGSLVRNYVPVLAAKNETVVAGLFDEVECKLYESGGSDFGFHY